jgi:hypothetical protein
MLRELSREGTMRVAENLVEFDYARVVLADMEDAERWKALARLGYDNVEIQWHIDHPREFMPQGFV